MKRVIGFALVLIGSAPVLLAFVAGAVLWSEHMYTVGLSVTEHGIAALTLLVLIDVLCLGAGVYLLKRRERVAV